MGITLLSEALLWLADFSPISSDVRSSHPIRHHQVWCERGSWEEPRGRYESLGFKQLYCYNKCKCFGLCIWSKPYSCSIPSAFERFIYERSRSALCVTLHAERSACFSLSISTISFREPFEPGRLRNWQTR